MSSAQSLEPVNVYLTWKKDFADIIKNKDLEIGRCSLIIWLSPASSHEYLTFLVEVGQGDVTVGEGSQRRDTAGLEGGRRGP